ncbi:MAG: hypothetical protein IKA69_01525 [Kiritimatiellae bacterium]|nr:hypothetical protein [Kiritimatiellia bacterium]
MAWNRSDNTGSVPVNTRAKGSRAGGGRKLLLAAAVVAALCAAVVVYFLLRDDGGTVPKAPEKPSGGKIAEVAPAVTNRAPAAPAVKEEGKRVEIRKLEDGRFMKYVDGKEAWMYPRRSIDPPARTNGQNRVLSIEQRIFKYRSDMEIAGLLMAHPGDMAIGDPEYDKFFKQDFLKSLVDPAFPREGDTEEERELKKAVTEVKAELKERYDAGEDLAKIMYDARKELRELGAYKQELEEEVRKRAKDGSLSAEDIDDLVTAANVMLESRGISPIRKGGFLRHQLKLRNRNAVGTDGEGSGK